MKKPLVSSLLLLCIFSVSITAKADEGVKIEECSAGTKMALEKSNAVLREAAVLWNKPKVHINIEQVTCIKWFEGNDVFHVTIHNLKSNNDERTAMLSLFGPAISVNTEPVDKYPSLLGLGLEPIKYNGKNPKLIIEDLNKDNRPEIVFAANTGLGAVLFAFQLNTEKKTLKNLRHIIKDEDGESEFEFVGISSKSLRAIEMKKTANGILIETPLSIISADNDQWILKSK